MRDLPNGWIEVQISELATTQSGGTPSTSKKEYWDNGTVPWLASGGLKDSIVKKPSKYITELGLAQSSARLFPRKTVLIALTGATTGETGLLDFACSTNQSVTGIFPSETYVPEYLFFYLQSAKRKVLENALGSAQPHINKKIVDDTLVPLAPLNEQKRIAEKLKKLLGKVETAQARLDKIPATLKRFRQAVLAAACSGKLTVDWRKKNGCSDEYKLLSVGEITDYIGGYAYKSPTFSNAGANQVLRIGNVRKLNPDLTTSPVFIPDDIANSTKRFKLLTNDIIISMTGTKYKRDYGFASLISKVPHNLFLNQRVSRLRCKEIVLPQFLLFWLQTDEFRDFFFEGETGNVNQGNVSADGIRNAPIELPPLEEQKEIVRRVKDLFKFADQIEARYKKARSYTDKLTQSILAKAFRGELVSQDEGDEPASVLLERIETEKSNNTDSVKGKQKLKPKILKEDEQQTLFANG